MNEPVGLWVGGVGNRRLSFTGPSRSYVEAFRDWDADTGSIARLTRDLPANGVAVDVGANIGLMALTLAARRPDIRVIAIEPIPANAEHLRRNVIVNQLANVEVIEAAAAESRGELAMKAAGECSWVTSERTRGHYASDQNRSADTVVECYALDDLIAGRVDFLKTDCEGSDHRVIAGARRLLGDSRPIVQMEFNLLWLLRFRQDPLAIADAIWADADIIGLVDREAVVAAPATGWQFLADLVAMRAGMCDVVFRPRRRLAVPIH
jgi:FkbM family methyltransferase